MIVAPLDDDSDIFVGRPLHPGARFLDLAVTGHKHVRHPAMVRSWLIAEHMINRLRLGYWLVFRVRLKGCCGTLVLQLADPQ